MSFKEVQQLQELLHAGGLGALLDKEGVPEQLQALLQHVRNQQMYEQLDTQRQQLVHQQRNEQGSHTSHLSLMDGEPFSQARSYQQSTGRQHDAGHQMTQQQAAAAAAVAAANNQQQVHALLQHQINLLQMQQHNQGVPPSVAGISGNSPVSSNQHQQHQAPAAAAAYHFGGNETAQQPRPQQLSPQKHQVAQPEPPQKRRRGRPASSSTRVHPNLVYVRRFRERQKQMENELEATVEARKQQLQQLQVEQQQLCIKWEALEQVLQVQNNVLVLMQQLNFAETTEAVAAEEQKLMSAVQEQEQEQEDGKAAAAASGTKCMAAGDGEPSANGAETETRDAGQQQQQQQQQPPATAFVLSEAAAAAAAALRLSRAQAALEQNQQQLLQQARHWLEPVRLYVMRAAVMLDELGMLPNNAAAVAALAAARACPAVAAATRQQQLPQATAAAVAAAISAAAAEAKPAAAATAAAAVASAVRSAWDGTSSSETDNGTGDQMVDGVPLVRYPYSIGMYVITPDPIKSVCWPMNMSTWRVDENNNQAHAEQAGRAMWAVLRPERWRLLRAIWLTMSNQLQQVQQDFVRLHSVLQRIEKRSQGPCRAASTASSAHSSAATTSAGAAAFMGDGSAQQQANGMQVSSNSSEGGSSPDGGVAGARSGQQQLQQQPQQQPQQQQQQGGHALCLDGFASMEDSTAYEYAIAAVQVENVLLREDAISFQLCGAFLELLDPLEVAVGYVSSWPYHPQAFTIFDVIFKLGEPPEELPMPPQ